MNYLKDTRRLIFALFLLYTCALLRDIFNGGTLIELKKLIGYEKKKNSWLSKGIFLIKFRKWIGEEKK